MRVSNLAFFSILGVAEATSMSGETIQYHMNKLDKLRLMKHSHRVVQGRKLNDDASSYQAYGSNSDYGNSDNGNNYGSYAKSNGYNRNSGSYQRTYNYNRNGGGGNYNFNNADNENYVQDVNRYYFENMRQGDFVIDGTKTIEFEKCVSLRSLNEDLAQYAGKNMQSTSDFVIFKVTDMFQKEFEFAVSIGDFVESLISTIPDDREEYCQVCQQSFQSCQEEKSLNEWNSAIQNTGNIGNYYGFNNKQKENEESNMRNWGWGGSDGMSYYASDYYAQKNGQYANGYNRGRKLQEGEEEESIKYIDCETCDSYGCFDQMYEQQKSYRNSGSNVYSQSGYHYYNNQDDQYTQYDDDQYTYSYQQRNDRYYENYRQQNQQQQEEQQFSTPMEAALNWVSEVAQCKELKMFDTEGSEQYYTNYKQQYNQQDEKQNQDPDQQVYGQSYGVNSYKSSLRNPYAGMMCNSDGSGMEIGIFMDAYCTIYDSSRSYKDIIKNGSPQYTYYELTKGLMEFTFTQPIDCKANQYAQPDWDSRADYDYYQQQQQQQQQANQYYSNAEDYYNAYNQQQDENYQQANEYYQEQSDAYYSYYMEGANVQPMDSCQQLFEQEVVQLGIPCTDGQQQYNQDQQNEQEYRQYYANENKAYGEFTFFSSYSGRQSYAYELQDPNDQEEVCEVMNTKMANDSFQKNAMSQSRFKNLYNYKLYSATTSWRGFRNRLGEGIQTFRHNTRERFRSIHEEEVSTKLAIISFLLVASMAIIFAISRWSAPYVSKGLTHAASHAVDHAERFAEHVKSMRSQESSVGDDGQDSLQYFNEIESFDFFADGQAEPSGRKHKLFY